MYRGDYDDGYEVLKERRAERARQLGVVSDDARTPTPHPMVEAWGTLSEEKQELYARAMEVYAGMVTNMDYHFGRVVSFLKDIGEYENTVILFLSDNGPNPWFSEDYPGNRGSKFMAQFDNSKENLGHPMSHYAYGSGWASRFHRDIHVLTQHSYRSTDRYADVGKMLYGMRPDFWVLDL